MIISLRGTNGSGKSTIIQGLLRQGPSIPIYGLLGPKRPEAYSLIGRPFSPLYVLGPYHVPSGGCDQVQPYDLILDLLEKYVPQGNVIFEGVLVSSSYGRVGALMERYGQEAVMAFLSTPLEDCIRNVEKRREARADGKAFDPANLTKKYKSVLVSKAKMLREGKVRVIDLELATALEQVLELLHESAN